MTEENVPLEPVETEPAPPVPAGPATPVAPPQSRFLFVDVAAQRAKQLRRGALPRLQPADVDPQDIADVIEGDSRPVGNLPTNFSGVGQLTLTVDACDISTAGIVIHGGLAVVTNSQLHAGAKQRRAYWFTEPAGGG